MRRLPLVLAIVSFLLALIIFACAGGARAIYSGSFFTMLGLVLLVRARAIWKSTSTGTNS